MTFRQFERKHATQEREFNKNPDRDVMFVYNCVDSDTKSVVSLLGAAFPPSFLIPAGSKEMVGYWQLTRTPIQCPLHFNSLLLAYQWTPYVIFSYLWYPLLLKVRKYDFTFYKKYNVVFSVLISTCECDILIVDMFLIILSDLKCYNSCVKCAYCAWIIAVYVFVVCVCVRWLELDTRAIVISSSKWILW